MSLYLPQNVVQSELLQGGGGENVSQNWREQFGVYLGRPAARIEFINVAAEYSVLNNSSLL